MENKNNQAELEGQVVSAPVFSHEIYGERFYELTVAAMRTSGTADVIPVLVSSGTAGVDGMEKGTYVHVKGQFRSQNYDSGNGHRSLALYLFAREFTEIGALTPGGVNSIRLDGFLCKPPLYRVTPLGREITEMIIAVSRPYGKSDYIPVIAWGRNAKMTARLDVGCGLHIIGRLQSRMYKKKLDEEHVEDRTAYEVSAFSIMETPALYRI